MTEHSFDIVILGAGSGGYSAALRAVECGRSVALVEKDRVGGTCLHRGCIPTKALLHAGEVAESVRTAAAVGVRATHDGIDPVALAAYRDGIVESKYKGLQSLLTARAITVVSGEGVLDADGAVSVGVDRYLGTDVVLATGSASRTLPGVELGGRVLSSDEALVMDSVPRTAIVLGGGVIGVEFASLWRSLGSEVTIVEALDSLLPTEDTAISKALHRAYRRRGITTHLGTSVTEVRQHDDGVIVSVDTGERLEADVLLVAVGRAPATDGIGLEAAGVASDGGFVRTDDRLHTTASKIWAVGDIVGGPQLAHRGFQQGIAVAERIAGMTPTVVPDGQIPRVTYSRPEVASVGETERAAVQRLGTDRVHTQEYNLNGNAKSAILHTSGLVKVVRERNGPVLGVHLIGDRVGELITEGQLAVGWEAHPEDIAPFLHAHPTQSEALGEAFLALAGKPLHSL